MALGCGDVVEYEMARVPRKRAHTEEDTSSETMANAALGFGASKGSGVGAAWQDGATVGSSSDGSLGVDNDVDDQARKQKRSRMLRACAWSSLPVSLGIVWCAVLGIMLYKWLWVYMWAVLPLALWLGRKLREETEPIFVVTGLVVPFVITGVLFYAMRPASPRLTSSEMPGIVTKLRMWRRSLFGGRIDSIDVAVITVFALVQLNTLVGKLLIDKYNNKIIVSGYFVQTGRALGMNGFYAVLLSIVLVARRSFVHEFLNLSSERAAKYHIWCGNFGSLSLGAHGLVYLYRWWMDGKLAESLIPCFDCDERTAYKAWRNLSGLVAQLALVVVALASLERVRRKHFRRFTFVHCLNVLFVVATCLHYYPAVYWFVAPMLVYVLYRVVSVFTRSRSAVVSARALDGVIVQLQLRREAVGLRSKDFLPGQYVYIKVDEISKNEWHPITISSSPLRDQNTFTLDIKVQGPFTTSLMDMVRRGSLTTVQVDGYYGTGITISSDMVFVAGGSGVTPFLSVLEHLWLLSQHEARDERLPSRVWIVWAARDLSLLQAHRPLLDQIRKSAPWEMHTRLYWTGADDSEGASVLEGASDHLWDKVPAQVPSTGRVSGGISSAIVFVATVTGAAVGMALVFLSPTLSGEWWMKRLGLLGAGVVGAMAGASWVLWWSFPSRTGFERVETDDVDMMAAPRKVFMSTPLPPVDICRSRPDVEAILRDVHATTRECSRPSDDVRVLVSGPSELQQRVVTASEGFRAPLLSVESRSFSL